MLAVFCVWLLLYPNDGIWKGLENGRMSNAERKKSRTSNGRKCRTSNVQRRTVGSKLNVVCLIVNVGLKENVDREENVRLR